MGVFKEEASAIEAVAKKQSRIYSDAADYGYAYNTNNPPDDIKRLIDVVTNFKAMDKQDPDEKLFVRNRQVWGDNEMGGVSLDVIIFWEKDEGFYRGTKYHISFNKTPKHQSMLEGFDSYISVDINSYSER